ncbi:MAG: hypothetical protein ACKPKO_37610, partial [Candidatus Fonsibacter sp.]
EEPEAFRKLLCEAADACPDIVVPKHMSLVAEKIVTLSDSKDCAGALRKFISERFGTLFNRLDSSITGQIKDIEVIV